MIFSNAAVSWSSKCSKSEKRTIVCVLWKERILSQNEVQVGWPLCMHAQCFNSISFCFSLICDVFQLENRWLQRGGSFAHDMTKNIKYSCAGQDGALLAGRGSALASFLYTL